MSALSAPATTRRSSSLSPPAGEISPPNWLSIYGRRSEDEMSAPPGRKGPERTPVTANRPRKNERLCHKDCADRDQTPVRSGPWQRGAVAWAEVAVATAQSSQRAQSLGHNQNEKPRTVAVTARGSDRSAIESVSQARTISALASGNPLRGARHPRPASPRSAAPE
jgi:hypothetical protein